MKASSEEIYDKSTQRTCGLQLGRYLHLFSCCCCLQYLWNPAEFSENSNLQQFKVIQGHRSWC